MKLNNKGIGNLVADECDYTRLSDIRNSFVEVSQTERKVTLVVFGDGLSKKSIPIGADTTATDRPNGTINSNLNKNPLIYVC